jgi:nicotinamide/nicotinate riboside kinase
VAFLREVKHTGEIPPDHRSHDHLNVHKDIPVEEDVEGRWGDVFERLKRVHQEHGERIVWGIVDGFLLYWHQVRPTGVW